MSTMLLTGSVAQLYLFCSIGHCCDIRRYLAHHGPLLLESFVHLPDEFLDRLPDIVWRVVELRGHRLDLFGESHVGEGKAVAQLVVEGGSGLALGSGFEAIKVGFLSTNVLHKWIDRDVSGGFGDGSGVEQWEDNDSDKQEN